MKKLLLTILTFITAGFFTVANAQDLSEGGDTSGLNYPSFQLLIGLGMGYAHNPDMDKTAKNEANFLADNFNTAAGESAWDPETSSARFTGHIDFELRFFMNNFGFGASTGYYICESEGKATSDLYSNEGTFTMQLGVVPFIGTVYYRSGINSNSFILLGAGVGYYSATMDIEETFKAGYPGSSDFSYSFKSSTIGYHLKAEYDYDFGTWFVAGGIAVRYVPFKDFKGEGVTLDAKASLTGATVYIAGGLSI